MNRISAGKISHVYKREEVTAREAWHTNHLPSILRISSLQTSTRNEAGNYFQIFTTYREELSANPLPELLEVRCEVLSSKETTNEAQKEKSDQETFGKEIRCELQSVAGDSNYVEQIGQCLHLERHRKTGRYSETREDED